MIRHKIRMVRHKIRMPVFHNIRMILLFIILITMAAACLMYYSYSSLKLERGTLVNHLDIQHSSNAFETDVVKIESDTFKTESDTAKIEPNTFKTESDTAKIEPDTFKTDSDTVKIEPDTFKTESDTVKIEFPTIMLPAGPLTLKQLRQKFLDLPHITNKLTIVTPTFNRTENLFEIFNNYCPLKDIIHKIIVLWNNIGEAVPENVTTSAAKCAIPVIIKIMPKNNLTSRFYEYPEIETIAILSIDDDLLLPYHLLRVAFRTWKKLPYLLVGFAARPFTKMNNTYFYLEQNPGSNKKSYNMILTGVTLIHRYYLELFTSTIPKEITDYILETTNCEDIAMNVMIGKYLAEIGLPQPVGIRIGMNKMNFKDIKIGHPSSSLWLRSNYRERRSQCLNVLAKVYGELHLIESKKIVHSARHYHHDAGMI